MLRFFRILLHDVHLTTRPGSDFREKRVGYETLDEHFARDMQRLDEESPAWSEPGRVANAKLRLSRGMPPPDVGLIFGEATLRQAQRELSQGGMVRMSGE
jgi:hypothetical protein